MGSERLIIYALSCLVARFSSTLAAAIPFSFSALAKLQRKRLDGQIPVRVENLEATLLLALVSCMIGIKLANGEQRRGGQKLFDLHPVTPFACEEWLKLLRAKGKARMEADCSVVETTLGASIRQAPNTACATIRPYRGHNSDNRRRSEDCGSLLLFGVVFRQKASPGGAAELFFLCSS